jgi:hypothetical protein
MHQKGLHIKMKKHKIEDTLDKKEEEKGMKCPMYMRASRKTGTKEEIGR